jgi:hypothetical protein
LCTEDLAFELRRVWEDPWTGRHGSGSMIHQDTNSKDSTQMYVRDGTTWNMNKILDVIAREKSDKTVNDRHTTHPLSLSICRIHHDMP